MLLAIDIGNTNISFALFNLTDSSKDPLAISCISSQNDRSADEYAVLIRQILNLHLPDGYSVSHVAISSVVPTITSSVAKAAEILSGSRPYIISPGTRTGFKISINDPACLGTDIVANVAAAFEFTKPPFVIFDAGTANTISVVDSSGTLTGTIIMPGLKISASALYNNAELLDLIPLSDKPISIIGKTTEESVCSGLIHGNAIMVDGFVRNIRESLVNKDSDEKLGLIATGGYAEYVIKHCRNKFIYDNSLTLRGIFALFLKNTRK